MKCEIESDPKNNLGGIRATVEEFSKAIQNPDPTVAQSKKEGCFIATACYGSNNASEIIVLKAFRDEVLLKRAIGRKFVQIYYAVSPPLARFVGSRRVIKKWTRLCIVGTLVVAVRELRMCDK